MLVAVWTFDVVRGIVGTERVSAFEADVLLAFDASLDCLVLETMLVGVLLLGRSDGGYLF